MFRCPHSHCRQAAAVVLGAACSIIGALHGSPLAVLRVRPWIQRQQLQASLLFQTSAIAYIVCSTYLCDFRPACLASQLPHHALKVLLPPLHLPGSIQPLPNAIRVALSLPLEEPQEGRRAGAQHGGNVAQEGVSRLCALPLLLPPCQV